MNTRLISYVIKIESKCRNFLDIKNLKPSLANNLFTIILQWLIAHSKSQANR